MSDTLSWDDPYSHWEKGEGRWYDQVLTSPKWWFWRFDGDPETFSRPTLKTVTAGIVAIILMTGLYSQTGRKNRDTVTDFRSALTQPEGSKSSVEELRKKIMAIAEDRASKGKNSPRIITLEVDTERATMRVLGEEIPAESK